MLAGIVGRRAQRLRLNVDGKALEIPVAAMKLFTEVLAQMALGRAPRTRDNAVDRARLIRRSVRAGERAAAT